MKLFFFTLFTALSLLSCSSNSTQSEATTTLQWDTVSGVSTGTLLRLDSSHTKGTLSARPLDVWLPSTYDGKRKHAVLYMYDGQMLFDANSTWNHQEWRVDEIMDSLIAAKTTLPTIIVALHHGGVMRNFEYFPQKPFQTLRAQFSDSTMAAIASRMDPTRLFLSKAMRIYTIW